MFKMTAENCFSGVLLGTLFVIVAVVVVCKSLATEALSSKQREILFFLSFFLSFCFSFFFLTAIPYNSTTKN